MAKIIKYKTMSKVNIGTAEEPQIQQVIFDAEMECATQAIYDANYPIVERKAIPGTIEVSGKFDYPTAPHNIVAGEYVTIKGVLYKATENIPSGEPVIVGHNAVITTVEEQLLKLKGE